MVIRLCLKNPKTPKYLNLDQLSVLKNKKVKSVTLPKNRLSFNDWSDLKLIVSDF